jgi:hypothetical protein
MTNHDPVAFEAAAREVGFLGFGFYPRSGFMHVDLGPARQWGQRFPARRVPFAAETPPAREVLAQSRTMKGGGAAGVATLGVAGVEVVQEVLAETQSAILPLVPYLDTLRLVFIAVAGNAESRACSVARMVSRGVGIWSSRARAGIRARAISTRPAASRTTAGAVMTGLTRQGIPVTAMGRALSVRRVMLLTPSRPCRRWRHQKNPT